MSNDETDLVTKKDFLNIKKTTWITIARIAALLFVIGLSIFIFLQADKLAAYMEQIPGLGWFAYPAIFAISIAANATIILPVPGVLLTSMFGSVFNPFLVAIAAGLGASFGELSGYLAGFSGQAAIERTKWSGKVERWMEKYGNWTVLVLAFIPNPLFDLAGMSAGALKMPMVKFLFWCAIGKILKMLAFAFLGDYIASFF